MIWFMMIIMWMIKVHFNIHCRLLVKFSIVIITTTFWTYACMYLHRVGECAHTYFELSKLHISSYIYFFHHYFYQETLNVFTFTNSYLTRGCRYHYETVGNHNKIWVFADPFPAVLVPANDIKTVGVFCRFLGPINLPVISCFLEVQAKFINESTMNKL